MRRMIATGAIDLPAPLLVELSCLDPWLIGYSKANCEHIAKASLERHGFECWYPVRKIITMKPARNLPSKTRHRRRLEVSERVVAVLPGYLFMRRLLADCDARALYELPGVGGLCMFGAEVATLPDYEIEMLRLAESDGRFNSYDASVPGTYRLSVHPDPHWTGISRTARKIGQGLDKSGNFVQFSEAFGRVLRVIGSTAKVGIPG